MDLFEGNKNIWKKCDKNGGIENNKVIMEGSNKGENATNIYERNSLKSASSSSLHINLFFLHRRPILRGDRTLPRDEKLESEWRRIRTRTS